MKSDSPSLAYAAAAVAFAFAVPSLYWALGGTALLDTLGGVIEERARARDRTLVAITWATVVLKVGGGLIPLALVQQWGRRLPIALVRFTAWGGAVCLVLYGALQTLTVGLVYFDVVEPAAATDERVLRWRLLLWEPWFLVWGVALGAAVSRHGHDHAAGGEPHATIT
jgi:hypothetical protein